MVNGLPWKRTEITLSFLKLHPSMHFNSFVDYEGYSISSKGFLPTVMDIMVIWIKSPIPIHFSLVIPKMLMFALTIYCLHMSAKLLQSRLTLCNLMDCSPPVSSVHGILQVRILYIPSPGDLPTPGIKSMSLTSPELAGGFFSMRTTCEAHMLLDHVQYTLIHEPNSPHSYTILFFIAADFNFTTRHIHNWAFPFWPSCLILSEAISNCLLLFPSKILDTFWPGGLIFWCYIFLPFHIVHGSSRGKHTGMFAILSSRGPCLVRTLPYDLSVLGGPAWHGS